jgi:hypothetical protein
LQVTFAPICGLSRVITASQLGQYVLAISFSLLLDLRRI